MRKRELQSIPLKLAELKEYDVVRNERAMARNQGQQEDATPEQPSPIANVGPKTKKEIQSRLNTTL
ncbi:PREDICTED: uncharacterized protein LOC108370448 [Rhagoletis zephyria]|uniref:uncharacterized protein LOC108354900 n=1 Tax=Rhagoletis zephyria TaxID=28612 RepID=UPI000811654A|nr:PREDICTED: uncharacterized protein LOC108354900 [Rhagoletis zephyria]XP_017481267.1 PREDICTED: uncharacterized protein LOC108370448 [Rhagoletis zephyria]XP_036318918.1 uncharacterized protein LOC118733580 [Rhagoletis pomonella]